MSADTHIPGRASRRRGLPRLAAITGALTGLSLMMTSCGTNPFLDEDRLNLSESAPQSESSPDALSVRERSELSAPVSQEVAQQVTVQREVIVEAGETLQEMQTRYEDEQDTTEEDQSSEESQTPEEELQDPAEQPEEDPEDPAEEEDPDQEPPEEDPLEEMDPEEPEDYEEGPEDEIPAEDESAEDLPAEEEPVPPPVEGNYPADLGLALEQIVDGYSGDFSISVAELGGEGRQGTYQAGTSRVTASTYKLFVAYSVLIQVESGSMSWEDDVTGGRDVAQCFHDMLALSDNPCPEALGPEIGWTTIYSDAAAVGAGSTGQGEGGIRTTASDLTAFLVSLESGSLNVSAEGHDRMREALAANIHRQGVPAGSFGSVLNKPGFINGNLHDAAIVHHPQGTYVVTVMSEGSSWEAIAGITREIEAALYG